MSVESPPSAGTLARQDEVVDPDPYGEEFDEVSRLTCCPVPLQLVNEH